MRRSAVQSPLPPNCNNVLVPSSFCVAPLMATAVIGGHNCLVSVPFSQTVAIIVLILLLPPKRTPIPDCDSRPRREAYNNDSQQHRRCNLRHVRRPLEVACVRTSVLPSFYALFDFFPVGIAMIIQPGVGVRTPPTPGQSRSQWGGRRDPRGVDLVVCLKIVRNPGSHKSVCE
jgi:hypothetical protein